MSSTEQPLRMSSALPPERTFESTLEEFSRIGYFPSSKPQPTLDPELQRTPLPRTPAFPIEKLQGRLPIATVEKGWDYAPALNSCLQRLDQFDADVFTEDAIWRDLFALSGTLRTFNTRGSISRVWTELLGAHHQSGFVLVPDSAKVIQIGKESAWIQARFSFVTTGFPKTLCSGQIGIVPDGQAEGGWKIWLLTTILEEILGFPNPDTMGPAGAPRASLNSDADLSRRGWDYEAVVVGAGFGGLCLSGRLQALNVKYLTLETNDRVGDNWRNRYDAARFHSTRDASDMPLSRVFTKDDPYYLGGQDLAKGYERWAEQYQLNIWTSSKLEKADFNEEDKTWTLHITRHGDPQAIRTPHFILAIGGGGQVPVMPSLPGKEQFKGEVLHSVAFKNASPWKGKKGVVIGTANTAHDVAEDMLRHGLSSVTMVQRGRTAVFPIEYQKMYADSAYNPSIPLEEADRSLMALPLSVTRLKSLYANSSLAALDPERFDSLEARGFRVERYGDLWKAMAERSGGHYIDVGASAKISSGDIKVKSAHGDSGLAGFTETGLRFKDGSELDADVVVFCTGFEHDVRRAAANIVGEELGERLEEYWELDGEGELRGAFKKMSLPGVWYHGGPVIWSRFFSRFTALQIKADVEGAPLKFYGKQIK